MMHSTAKMLGSALLITAVATLLCHSVHAQAPAPPQPDMPADYAALLRPKLPAGWRCTYDFDTLVISRDEEVALLGRIGMPPVQNREELIRNYSIRSPYLFVLTFTTRLSDDEQRELLARREAALAAVRAKYLDPRLGKERYGAEHVEAAKHRIPQYHNYRFSIHLHATTDELSGNLYLAAPEAAIKERNDIMRLLIENMTVYAAPAAEPLRLRPGAKPN